MDCHQLLLMLSVLSDDLFVNYIMTMIYTYITDLCDNSFYSLSCLVLCSCVCVIMFDVILSLAAVLDASSAVFI